MEILPIEQCLESYTLLERHLWMSGIIADIIPFQYQPWLRIHPS